MVTANQFQKTPEQVAKFLRTEGLSKAPLGDYLGEHLEFNVSVLCAFLKTFEFTNETFDGALR
jgi:Sec7-like guanine-nucleotide exchange factor